MIIYTSILAALLLWTVFNSLSLPRLRDADTPGSEAPLVSILVPLRNEERNIRTLVESLKNVNYPSLQFVFLDDGSEDRTNEKLHQLTADDERMQIVEGKPLPEGWVGKVHACHQLSQFAEGTYYLFLDADVRVHQNTVTRTLAQFKQNTGMVTGFPYIPLKSALGHLLVPMQHFLVYVHLPVLLANYFTWPRATAAHGAFMMFRAEAYDQTGGHAAVKNSLVEDIHIARVIKKSGWIGKLVNNTNSVTCYMYESNKEVWEGFAKNFFPGLGRNIWLAAFIAFSYAILFVLPLPLALYAVFLSSWEYAIPLLCITGIKFTVDIFSRQKWWLALMFPLSVVTMIIMLAYSVFLGSSDKGFTWKGRTYQ